MSTEFIVKDLGDIYSRLFNHHGIINGEAHLFISEFQEKRNDRELNRLQRAHEYCRDVTEKQIPEAKQLAETHLSPVLESVKALQLKCTEIVDMEENLKSAQNGWIEEQRKRRVAEWSKFMDEMVIKSAELDKEKSENILKAELQYKELEQRLKIKT